MSWINFNLESLPPKGIPLLCYTKEFGIIYKFYTFNGSVFKEHRGLGMLSATVIKYLIVTDPNVSQKGKSS